jgi:hypothetical protein
MYKHGDYTFRETRIGVRISNNKTRETMHIPAEDFCAYVFACIDGKVKTPELEPKKKTIYRKCGTCDGSGHHKDGPRRGETCCIYGGKKKIPVSM